MIRSRIKLARLKYMLKEKYVKLVKEEDKMSCGKELAEYMRPDLGLLRWECNNLYDKCQELEKS